MITPSETSTASPAARTRARMVKPPVSPRKTGIVPSGSMITNSVTKASPKKRGSIGRSPGERRRPGRQRQQLLVLVRRRAAATADPHPLVGAVVVAGAGDQQSQLGRDRPQ